MIEAYHGTAERYVPSILQRGLIPEGASGADEWAAHNGNRTFIRNREEPRVYVSTDVRVAEQFAAYTADLTRSKPIVLAVRLPTLSNWREDDRAEDMKAYWSREPVPPTEIAVFKEVEPDYAARMVRHFSEPDRLLAGIIAILEGDNVR